MLKKLTCLLFAALLVLTGCQNQPAEDSAIEASDRQLQEVSGDQKEGSANAQNSVENPVGEESSEPEESSQNQGRLEDADELLASMTLEEKVGQLFFARFPGTETAAALAEEYHLGGYILFGVDFEDETEQGVMDKISACQTASDIPMLMGVDEEGGTVTRVSDYFRGVPFKSPRELYEEGGWDLIVSDTEEKCDLLRSFGLNVNLAPVCDLAGDPNDFMYSRSFGDDPDATSELIQKTIETMNRKNMGAVLKHFPGYGNNEDTHTGIAIDERPLDGFYDQDFKPFEAGMESGAGSVLVCHNIVKCFDAELPASLSPEVHRVLRKDLGFAGVIMTDDLAMGAILDYCGETNAAVLAVEAGNDLLISTEFEEQYQSIMAAIQEGRITEERIDESVRRVLIYKQSVGLI